MLVGETRQRNFLKKYPLSDVGEVSGITSFYKFYQ